MSIDINILKDKLNHTFKNSTIEIYDEVGDGNHLSLSIISDYFKELNTLERHKLIYKCLKEYMPYIHALSINAKTYDGD